MKVCELLTEADKQITPSKRMVKSVLGREHWLHVATTVFALIKGVAKPMTPSKLVVRSVLRREQLNLCVLQSM